VRIGFLHPDLGLGGAERLVVDAARALQAAGHRVAIFTAHHDRARAFPETCDGSLDVRVRGGWLPAHVLQRLRVPCAIARTGWAAAALARSTPPVDVVFCDLVAHVIPVLRLLGRAPVVFYCHFPDHLLAPRRRGLYRWYRAPIDRLEEVATGMADRVLVNSRFTAARFHDAFPRLRGLVPEVLHPGVEVTAVAAAAPAPAEPMILCIGRYHPGKNLALAVDALAALGRTLPAPAFAPVRLVIAGSYDTSLRESRETLAGLAARAARLGVAERVSLLRSPTEAERRDLLSRARCVVYTPEHEHFGLVPLEAMAAARPVVAVSQGGPAETIRDGETGFLCAPTAEAFAAALARLIAEPELAARLGRAGRADVAARFSRAAFGARLDTIVRAVAAAGRRPMRRGSAGARGARS
jgi:alpha-1,3/alpha-1,6-mannosyltransferase